MSPFKGREKNSKHLNVYVHYPYNISISKLFISHGGPRLREVLGTSCLLYKATKVGRRFSSDEAAKIEVCVTTGVAR